MCCFSGPVKSVGKTKIYAGSLGGRKRALVYQMDVESKADVAMILPVPNKMGTEIEFVNLDEYPTFFKDLESLFPANDHDSLSFGGQMRGTRAKSVIEVQQVGSYEASYVPSKKDFDRLDERFRFPKKALDNLPYDQFGFAVFQLKKGNNKFHPMAFTYECTNDKLFFPTLHIHDGGGDIHDHEDYDHVLYAGWNTGISDWRKTDYKTSSKVDLNRADSVLTNDVEISRKELDGKLINGDMIIDGNTPNHSHIEKQWGLFRPSAQEIRDEAFEKLAEFAKKDDFVDKSLKVDFENMVGMSDEEVLEPLLFVLDKAVYGGLVADIVISMLDSLFKQSGGTNEMMPLIRISNREKWEEAGMSAAVV
jgi:hypothetical protein